MLVNLSLRIEMIVNTYVLFVQLDSDICHIFILLYTK